MLQALAEMLNNCYTASELCCTKEDWNIGCLCHQIMNETSND